MGGWESSKEGVVNFGRRGMWGVGGEVISGFEGEVHMYLEFCLDWRWFGNWRRFISSAHVVPTL